MAVAKPKIAEFNEQRALIIQDYVRTLRLNEFACKKLERELLNLLGVPQFEGLARIELGLLQAMGRKYESAKHHLDRASVLVAGDSVSIAMADCALYCWDVRAAYEKLSALELPANPDTLKFIRVLAIHAGMFRLARECNELIEAMGVDLQSARGKFGADSVEDLSVAANLVCSYGVTDKDISDRVHIASQVVARHVPDQPSIIFGFSSTFEAGILYEFPLRLSVDELVEIDWEISEAIAENFEDQLCGLISFSTKPFSESSSRIA